MGNTIGGELFERTLSDVPRPQVSLTIPDDPEADRNARVRLQESSKYHTIIQNTGLNDITRFIRVIECKPDNLRFRGQANVNGRCENVSGSDKFILFGQRADGTWQDMSESCSLTRSSSRVSFKLQHFSDYILVAILGSVALHSAIKLLSDCLNGKSFPLSFTPYTGKISGNKQPLTIVCREGYNVSAPKPETYRRFGLVGTSEFNIFDEERLTIKIKDLGEKCSESYQINRAICRTEKGQALDMILKPGNDERVGHAEISVCRLFKEKKACSLNLTMIEGESSPRSSETGVRKYFFFIKEKVSSHWKDFAFFLDHDDATINNIAGRNPDDKSRCMDMLEDWQKRQGTAATIEVLLEALSQAGLQDIVDRLKMEYPEIQALFGACGGTCD